ncbi:MAG: orotidine-5'-phosphate decarboxylase [Candidatus Dadabacteria bacterium]|nr:MAG: orotidine-5'-phosphate decarboxylase [Candidatus Dadabacteria bacterium]
MFSDRLLASIKRSQSVIVAGFDPRIERIPEVFIKEGERKGASTEEQAYWILTDFHIFALHTLSGSIAAIKPNIAFYEQFGIGGLKAFRDICLEASQMGIPVIADVKRGDIGSTAESYSRAFLGKTTLNGTSFRAFCADAITVSPFLGLDTLKAFLSDCIEYEKGLFVLVQTSNQGAKDIQAATDVEGITVSKKIAYWIRENASALVGENGISGLGAVVGATYPTEAVALRSIMENSFFLIPGLGAQGATAKDAVAGFGTDSNGSRFGGVINISRGLLGSFSSTQIDKETAKRELINKAQNFNAQINEALR